MPLELADRATARGDWEAAVPRWEAVLATARAGGRTHRLAVGRLREAWIHHAADLCERAPETAADLVLAALAGPPAHYRPSVAVGRNADARRRAAHLLLEVRSRPSANLLARRAAQLRVKPLRPVAAVLARLLGLPALAADAAAEGSALDPAVLSACLVLRGQALFRGQEVTTGVYEEASGGLRRALALDVHPAVAREVLIELASETWRHDEALELYSQIPRPSVYCTRQYARVLMELGRHQEARELLLSALEENPFNKGLRQDCLTLSRVLDLSEELEAHALTLPERAGADDEILFAFQLMASLGLEKQAISYVLRSPMVDDLHDRPVRTFWSFCASVAEVYFSQGRYAEALYWCTQGLARCPDGEAEGEVRWQKLLSLKTLAAAKAGSTGISLQTADRLQGKPRDRARYLAHLYAGDLQRAWEHSVELEAVQELRSLFGERYGREDLRLSELRDRALVVVSSGGIGDQIRLLTLLEDLGAHGLRRLTVSCDPRLAPLLERSVPGLRTVAVTEYRGFAQGPVHADRDRLPARAGSRMVNNELYEAAGEHDVVLNVFDLLRRLRPDPSSFRHSGPYLHPLPRLVETWRARLGELGPRPKVGLSWRSGLLSMARQDEYTRLAEWAELLLRRDVDVINLQYALAPEERELLAKYRPETLERWPELDLKDDIEDLAALVQALDLVIAPCTAIMELAGAVGGKALYVSTNESSAWRRRDTEGRDLFFPNVRIVSPEVAGDTTGMIAAALSKMESLLLGR